MVSSANVYNKFNDSKILNLENINTIPIYKFGSVNSIIIAFTIIPVEHLSFRF